MPLILSYNITEVVIMQCWCPQNQFRCLVAHKEYVL